VRLEVLRATVQAAAEPRTLRKVAAEIGMSIGGLHPFLKGGQPRPATLKKLSAWYLRHAATTGEADAELAAAAVDVLLVGIPDAEREEARARVLESVRESYMKAGVPPPPWAFG
jgi:hypothetical protein